MMVRKTEKSSSIFREAEKHLVGGVNSPVRAFKSVGGSPLFIERGEGPYIYDVDGNRYIDYVGSFGPLILGHIPQVVQEAATEAIKKGTTFGASTEYEIRLAELIKEAFRFVDKVRFVNSGTEALMSAIRLARAFSGKNKIIKFAGCYHGHSDFLLAQAGSGVLTLSLPGSAGVPEALVGDTLVAGYNNLETVKLLFATYPDEIGTIVIEPVAGNMGVVLPETGFLEGLRKIASENNAVLIFDEVMSGFRENFGGVQKSWHVIPDIVCLGKIIGGGFPVGAYAGRSEIMDMVAPVGPVYQAGTLSGNPVAMAAGIALLSTLRDYDLYDNLNATTTKLCSGIEEQSKLKGFPISVARYGSMFTPFVNEYKVTDYTTAQQSNTEDFGAIFRALLGNGIYPPPSQFEAWFVSTEHNDSIINETIEAFGSAFQSVL